MKLKKLKLNELSKTELNEREMCRILGGAGACQCGCHYAGTEGGSSSSDNDKANDAKCLTSDPTPTPVIFPPLPNPHNYPGCGEWAQDAVC